MKNMITRIAVLAASIIMTLTMSIPAFAATSGGTAADPIQAKSSDTATIYLGKNLAVSQNNKFPAISDFTFDIENIKAWDNANTSAGTSGAVISAENMPMPTVTTAAHHSIAKVNTTKSRVTVGSFTGDANTGASDTATEKYRTTSVPIRFTKAGYYMYKVTENTAETISVPGMAYDTNSYYVVVYVCNKTDAQGNTTSGVYVHDITSYRNNSETNVEPDLSDIQNTPDNNGQAAKTNNYSNYAKVGISDTDPGTPGTDPDSGLPTGPDKLEAFRFYNDQTTHDVVLTNNVTGNLGDITKEFEYKVTLTGLEKSREYTTNAAAQGKSAGTGINANTTTTGADIVSLASGGKGTVDSSAKSFTSDADGNAIFMVKLADDEVMVLNALPATSKYQVQELANDHISSYISESTENDTWVMVTASKSNAHSDLALDTANETVDGISNVTGRNQQASENNDGTVTINFKNHKDLMTPTGLPYYGNFVYVLAVLVMAGIAFFIARKRRSSESA